MKSNLKISYPGSEKVYLNGVIHPSVKVGMRVRRLRSLLKMEKE